MQGLRTLLRRTGQTDAVPAIYETILALNERSAGRSGRLFSLMEKLVEAPSATPHGLQAVALVQLFQQAPSLQQHFIDRGIATAAFEAAAAGLTWQSKPHSFASLAVPQRVEPFLEEQHNYVGEEESGAPGWKADSVRRKRKRKMNKHKHSKRRKLNRHRR